MESGNSTQRWDSLWEHYANKDILQLQGLKSKSTLTAGVW